jgi:hypothetical protein
MKTISIVSIILTTSILAACQTVPRQHNGVTGYEVENQAEQSATIAYTLSARANQEIDQVKLQRTCQKVLNSTQQYKINILSINEIVNPAYHQEASQQVQIGQSRASFGLSNTQSLHNTEDFNTRQALENKPSLLQVVRYTCTL